MTSLKKSNKVLPSARHGNAGWFETTPGERFAIRTSAKKGRATLQRSRWSRIPATVRQSISKEWGMSIWSC